MEKMPSTTQLDIGQTPKPKVNAKVKCHDHVRHINHLGNFPQVPHVSHLHIIGHAQCYNLYLCRE